jgi:multidrug efflux pump subunit AcrB
LSGFNISALAVRERAVTLFLIIAISVAGVFAFLNFGGAEDPNFTIKVITIAAAWPGATAQEMQDQVAEPLEKRMQELTHYDRTETYTRPGFAFITLWLKDTTPPKSVPERIYQARKKLLDETPRLPRGVAGPFVNDEFGDVTFALYALKARSVPPRLLAREAERVRSRLLAVPGVKKVVILGERPERIYVNFSNARLAALGLAPRDVFATLADRNLLTPAGAIETRGPEVQVRIDGAIDSLEAIRATPVAADGRLLRLGDIADVRRGYEDPPTYLIRHQGEPALELGVVMRERYNGLQLGRDLKAATQAISADMPLGVSFEQVTDQSVNIDEAYSEFMVKFVVALSVVIAISLISLGWRVGLVVAAAVPLTLAAVFVIMLATGRDFDRITLGALILSLGLLVDDAIIIIEAMVVKMEEGLDRIAAATWAWGHTASPMLSGTLVTAIGLMPVGFAQSGAGEYAGNIFWVVMFALLASWVVAVAFTPYIGVRLLPEIEPVAGGRDRIYGTPAYQRLRRAIALIVARKKLVTAAVVGLFFLSVLGVGLIDQQFFPNSDRPEVLVEVQMPEGSSIASTSRATARMEAWLRRQPEAQMVTAYVGQGAPRFVLNISPELPDPSFAKIVVLTPTEATRDSLKQRVRQAAADGLVPEARIRVSQIVFGPPFPWPIAFRVMGPDVPTVRALAGEVERTLVATPDARSVNTDWGTRVPTLRLAVDQQRIGAIGLTSRDVAEQLQAALSGSTVTEMREDIRSVAVVVRADGPARLDPARIGDLTLTTRSGDRAPLDQIGRMEIRMEEPILRRWDRTPTITVRADAAEGRQPPAVAQEVLAKLEPLIARLPPGYAIEAGAALEESSKANAALAQVFPVMLILMMVVIMVQVRSIPAMVMVLLTAPLSLVGVVPTLLLFQQSFGFNAILGLIGLAGIIMRNTLILIAQIQTNQAEGMTPHTALVEATVQRARPVLLTALAAVLAFVPLTFSVFWGSLAFTLIGGTIAGTILTLVFLPALFALWFRIVPPADGADPEQQGRALHPA